MARLQLAAAALLAAFALFVWWGFLRRVPEVEATGTIESRVHKPAGTYDRVPVELSRGFRTPTRIPIAPAWLFEVRLDGSGEIVGVSESELRGEDFAVGDRVGVRFSRRGFPPFWTRATVSSMDPIQP